ncbi:MAG: hypothetical protein K0R38_2089 [Polyangiaceae bacterium]|jgi:hypothetical protein|nr:hypothetical protein [Polyangiaceae bacterium]
MSDYGLRAVRLLDGSLHLCRIDSRLDSAETRVAASGSVRQPLAMREAPHGACRRPPHGALGRYDATAMPGDYDATAMRL